MEVLKNYFIEYPTNCPPSHYNLGARGNSVYNLSELEYETLSESFKSFVEDYNAYKFLHAPSYVIAFCNSREIVLDILS